MGDAEAAGLIQRVCLEYRGSRLPSPAKDNESHRRLVRSHRDSPPPGTEKSSPTNPHELPRDKQVFAECCLHLEQINFKQRELEDKKQKQNKKKTAKMALKQAELSLFQESQTKSLKTNDLFTFLFQPQNEMLF